MECGRDEYSMLGSRCMRCEAPRKLRAVISDEHGQPHPQLRQLESFLLAHPERSEAVVKWSTRAMTSRMVHDMATGKRPVSLRAVAEEPATAGSSYLAALLLEAGVVPVDNFDRIRLEVWEEEYFASVKNATQRRLLQRYASWAINPLFSNEAHLAESDQGQRFNRPRSHLMTVHDFLEKTAALGYDIGSLPQQAFDEYVATEGGAGRDLTPFIRWCHRNSLTRLRSHYPQSNYPNLLISDDERWRWLKELLTAEDLPMNSRVAGLLTMTYGIPMTRLVTLRRDAFEEHGSCIHLRLSVDPVTLPEQIATLVHQLLAQLTVDHPRQDSWMFPGHLPGRHITPSALTKPLRKRGIRPGRARSVALMALSRDAAPSVLADLLGISIRSAERWGKHAAHDWVDYPRLRRSRDSDDTSPTDPESIHNG